MKQSLFILFLLCCGFSVFAQQEKDSIENIFSDTLKLHELDEVVIIANPTIKYIKDNKALGSVDNYLEQSNVVNMIKRGAYAWEPMLNGMSTERSVLTIDGMRIFHACTDKMDPITSYVENTNLSIARIEEGQSGSEYGATIAGSIDLTRRKTGFRTNKKFGGSVFAGFESNNKQQIYGATLNYASKYIYTDVDFTYRDAENYKSGHQSGKSNVIDFSQFTKYNTSATIGVKLAEKHELEGSIIYDKATDVGYPGLPMDVSLAEAVISSIAYHYKNPSEHVKLWETKLYYNTITHKMDDSPRPVVPIRMDMPGWSKTGGFYSKIMGEKGIHSFKATLSGYLNNSIAEMTMYPNDPGEKDMFMLTWPDVNTLYSGLNMENNILFTPHLSLLIEGGIGVHKNKIKSELGLNSLRLFYPDLKPTKTRLLKNISTHLSYHHKQFLYSFGIGYGDRAPTVSEGYGFYLLNVNDNYDYVGNPNMKNEKALNTDFSVTYKNEKFTAKAKVNYFYIIDYIVGKIREDVPPMNITASGIKVYEQLNYAHLFNSSLSMNYNFIENWSLSGDASYRYGQGAKNTVLPLIQPFSYKIRLRYEQNSFYAEASIEGSSQNRNSIEFGETQKPAYVIANLALSKNFTFAQKDLTLKFGIENLFNKYYSAFDNWFGIPRMGRNIYGNIIFRL